jgi:vitamin B12 transporter
MKVFRFVAGSLLVPFSLTPLSIAVAQESTGATLDPIVVTATLGPKTVGESLASVTVISEEDIRYQQPKEFRQLIESQPGVSVTNNGGFGKATSVFIRGNSSDASVLLIDGIQIRSATSGGAAWQHIPPQLINRVEIVRGSRSSLYGADATGGVIQAFTLPQKEGPSGWLEAGAGNYDTQQFGSGVALSNSSSKLSLGVNRFQTDGTAIVRGGVDRGYDRTSGVASGSHEFNNGVRAGFTFLNAEGNNEYEGFGPNPDANADFVFQVAGVKLDIPVTTNWRTSLQLSDARDESVNYSGTRSVFNTKTRNSRLENWFTAGTHEFVLGAEYSVDQVDSTVVYDETSRSNSAFFGQALLNFNALDVHLSLRNDDNEAFGTEQTWGAGVGYAIDRNHRIRTSAGTSFKAPSFNSLYYPNYGDPTLQPEEAISYELGIEGRYVAWFWDVALFQSDVEDLSLPSKDSAGSVPEARLRGVELSGGWKENGWSLRAAATVGNYEDKTTKKQLIRRAENTIRLDLDKELGTWTVGTTVRAEAARDDELRKVRKRIAGYGTWDLRAQKVMAPGWVAALKIGNLADKKFTTLKGSRGDYISEGRTAFLSVRYDFIH